MGSAYTHTGLLVYQVDCIDDLQTHMSTSERVKYIREHI